MDIGKFINDGVDNWNKRNKDAYLADFENSCEIIGPGGMVFRGRDGAELFWHTYQDAFPNNHITVRAAFGSADAGAEEAAFEGTHTGVLRSGGGSQMHPSGRRVRASYAGVYTFRNERIATFHLYFDQVDFLAQLGFNPHPDT